MKCYRIEAYILSLNGDFPTKETLAQELKNIRHIEHLHVEDIQETDVGEWHDDHELNLRGANYKKFFPDTYPGPNDALLKEEYRMTNAIMLHQMSRNDTLKRQNRDLTAEIEKLKKIQDFVKTIGDLTK